MALIQTIVVPIDFSGPARIAVQRAAALATRLGAAIHLLHAARFPLPLAPGDFGIPGPAWDTLLDNARREVARVAAGLRDQGLEVSEEVSDLDPVDAIRSAVDQHHADLVVMGTHGHRGVEHFVLGSVAERTLRTCDCPVFAVKGKEGDANDAFERILVASDFSDHAAAALDFAVELAKALGAQLDLVHAFSVPSHYFTPYGVAPPDSLVTELVESARAMLQARADAVSKRGVEIKAHFVRGAASSAISDLAAKVGADAIVMGTRGNTGLKHVFLGSVAERTLRLAPCSVFTVKAQGGA